MFSQTVEYALRAMVYLAKQAPASSTTDEVARAMQVPRAYLAKILQALNRAGLVHSQRGLGGGMTLTRGPHEINLLDVVEAVDPICRIQSCPLQLPEHSAQLCPLHRRLDDALGSIEAAFRATNLSDVLDDLPATSGGPVPAEAPPETSRAARTRRSGRKRKPPG